MSPRVAARPLAAAALALLGAFLLGSCTPAPGSERAHSPQPSASGAAPEPSCVAEGSGSHTSGSAPGTTPRQESGCSERPAPTGLAAEALRLAGSLAGSQGVELNCSGGSAQVSTDGAVVRIHGGCSRLTVSGIGVLIIADSIDELEVTGTGVAVAAGSLRTVTITGTGAMISHAGPEATVRDLGTGNRVSSEPLTP